MQQYFARDYRRMAEEKCNKFTNKLAIIYLLYIVINAGLAAIGVGAIVSFILEGAFLLSFVIINEKVYKGIEPDYNDLFEGTSNLGGALLLYIIEGIYIFLWTLLFIIPGIVKTYSYSMAFYIYNDNKNMSATECINESRRLMDGHKWELFCLEFSYIGWIFLSILTCGILSFWVVPKMQMARYLFYLHITGKDQITEEEEDFVFTKENVMF